MASYRRSNWDVSPAGSYSMPFEELEALAQPGARPAYTPKTPMQPTRGWQNPAMQASPMAGSTNPLVGALQGMSPMSMRQAEAATAQILPPAYGFAQEMAQAPLIQRMRQDAARMYGASQGQAVDAFNALGRNDLARGELGLQRELGLGKLGLDQSEQAFKQDPQRLQEAMRLALVQALVGRTDYKHEMLPPDILQQLYPGIVPPQAGGPERLPMPKPLAGAGQAFNKVKTEVAPGQGIGLIEHLRRAGLWKDPEGEGTGPGMLEHFRRK